MTKRSMAKTGIEMLVLGGAQIGLPYGIANRERRQSEAESFELIRRAAERGVKYIDTARAYGDSEVRIGAALDKFTGQAPSVVTKLSPLAECRADASVDEVIRAVEVSIETSLMSLNCAILPTVLLHRASHLDAWNGAAWSRLLEYSAAGVIGRLGVSVQNPEELLRALDEPLVRVVQLPCNILDDRWTDAATSIRERSNAGLLEVHVRGVFLQGLLLLDNESAWRRAHCDDYRPVRRFLDDSVRRLNREGVADLCVAFIRSLDWVDKIVVGMDSVAQLDTNLALFSTPTLTETQLMSIMEERSKLPGVCQDPSKWKVND